MVDEVLHKIHIACISSGDPRAKVFVYEPIAWYILTGRASLDWVRALQAKSAEVNGLVESALSARDQSTNGIVRRVSSFIGQRVRA